MLLYHILQPVVRCLIRIYHRARVEGLDRVPAEGPLILVGNHLSLLDPFYIGAFFPRKIRFMAKKESFRHPVARWFGPFSRFSRGSRQSGPESLKTAIGVLRSGEVLGMFPEGGRRENAPMRELKQGAAYLALKTGTPILPVYIEGTDQSLPRNAVWIRPPSDSDRSTGNASCPTRGERAPQRRADQRRNPPRLAADGGREDGRTTSATVELRRDASYNGRQASGSVIIGATKGLQSG